MASGVDLLYVNRGISRELEIITLELEYSNHFACQGLCFEQIGLPNLNNVLTMNLGAGPKQPQMFIYSVYNRRSPDMDLQVLSNP